MSKSREEVRNALKQADAAARRNDLRDAERWSKTAERLAAAFARAAEVHDPKAEEDEEALRADLKRRLFAFAEADRSLANWQAERELYEANLFAAIANNTDPPPPLRPQPGAPMTPEEYLVSIIGAPYP